MNKAIKEYFGSSQFPKKVQPIAAKYFHLAVFLEQELEDGPEKFAALDKLLESRNAAIQTGFRKQYESREEPFTDKDLDDVYEDTIEQTLKVDPGDGIPKQEMTVAD